MTNNNQWKKFLVYSCLFILQVDIIVSEWMVVILQLLAVKCYVVNCGNGLGLLSFV